MSDALEVKFNKPTTRFIATFFSANGHILGELSPSDNREAVCYLVDTINSTCRGRIRAQVSVDASSVTSFKKEG